MRDRRVWARSWPTRSGIPLHHEAIRVRSRQAEGRVVTSPATVEQPANARKSVTFSSDSCSFTANPNPPTEASSKLLKLGGQYKECSTYYAGRSPGLR